MIGSKRSEIKLAVQDAKNIYRESQSKISMQLAFIDSSEKKLHERFLLSEINSAYVAMIESIERRNNSLLQQKRRFEMKTFSAGKHTHQFYEKRKQELEKKLDCLRLKNEIVRQQMLEIELENEQWEPEKVIIRRKSIAKEKRLKKIVPYKILSYADSIQKEDILDVQKLKGFSKQLDCEMIFDTKNKNKMRSYNQLEETMRTKQGEKDVLQERNNFLCDKEKEIKEQIMKLKENFTLDYTHSSSNIQEEKFEIDGCESKDPFIPYIQAGLFDSDEPKDVVLMSKYIQYYDTFQECFVAGNFDMAAKRAANSPDGILRKYQVFLQFKNVEGPVQNKSPLMLFCMALMETSTVDNGLLSRKLSFEILKCATQTQNFSLAQHWLCNKFIQFSLPLGDILYKSCVCECKCTCGYILLALKVYSQMKATTKIIQSHLRLQNFNIALKIMQNSDFTQQDCTLLFTSNPGVRLFLMLSKFGKKYAVALPLAISTFLQFHMHKEIVKLLQYVIKNTLNGLSLLACLMKETFDDEMSNKKWLQVLDLCGIFNATYVMEELYAVLLTRASLENATLYCLTSYIS